VPPSPTPHLYEAPPAGALAIGVSPATAQAQLQDLRDEEARLLATAVGEHLPAEISARVEAIRLRVAAIQGATR
jgi:hypothetical protein